mmetsp:Transcript_31720/g.67470  ORF Transcript_31720/g.67470 Transcript_31720/m.67470 type:complete len:261 (+) Transcript_31720:344-1126(+)
MRLHLVISPPLEGDCKSLDRDLLRFCVGGQRCFPEDEDLLAQRLRVGVDLVLAGPVLLVVEKDASDRVPRPHAVVEGGCRAPQLSRSDLERHEFRLPARSARMIVRQYTLDHDLGGRQGERPRSHRHIRLARAGHIPIRSKPHQLAAQDPRCVLVGASVEVGVFSVLEPSLDEDVGELRVGDLVESHRRLAHSELPPTDTSDPHVLIHHRHDIDHVELELFHRFVLVSRSVEHLPELQHALTEHVPVLLTRRDRADLVLV